MFDSIDPRSPTPLYEQIGACVRMAVATGELEAGETLPSVRQLAGSLRINPATVSQAYRELAREGFVEMRHGSGTFVREIAPARKEEEQWLRTRELVRKLLDDAARMGVSVDDLLRILRSEAGLAGDPEPRRPGIEAGPSERGPAPSPLTPTAEVVE